MSYTIVKVYIFGLSRPVNIVWTYLVNTIHLKYRPFSFTSALHRDEAAEKV